VIGRAEHDTANVEDIQLSVQSAAVRIAPSIVRVGPEPIVPTQSANESAIL
jgi:hypothetical protein